MQFIGWPMAHHDIWTISLSLKTICLKRYIMNLSHEAINLVQDLVKRGLSSKVAL